MVVSANLALGLAAAAAAEDSADACIQVITKNLIIK